MCDYCVQHGAGKRWYLNARNLSKELVGAIKVDPINGIAKVNTELCYGCGVCSRICPEQALESEKELRSSEF